MDVAVGSRGFRRDLGCPYNTPQKLQGSLLKVPPKALDGCCFEVDPAAKRTFKQWITLGSDMLLVLKLKGSKSWMKPLLSRKITAWLGLRQEPNPISPTNVCKLFGESDGLATLSSSRYFLNGWRPQTRM